MQAMHKQKSWEWQGYGASTHMLWCLSWDASQLFYLPFNRVLIKLPIKSIKLHSSAKVEPQLTNCRSMWSMSREGCPCSSLQLSFPFNSWLCIGVSQIRREQRVTLLPQQPSTASDTSDKNGTLGHFSHSWWILTYVVCTQPLLLQVGIGNIRVMSTSQYFLPLLSIHLLLHSPYSKTMQFSCQRCPALAKASDAFSSLAAYTALCMLASSLRAP